LDREISQFIFKYFQVDKNNSINTSWSCHVLSKQLTYLLFYFIKDSFIYSCLLYLLCIVIIGSTLDDLINSKSQLKKKRLPTIFSLYTNVKSLFSFDVPENSISCIHGIKTLSMMIIVFHHSYQILFNSTSLSFSNELQNFKHRSLLLTILATDSFFVLSGFLSVKCFMQKDST